MKKNIVILFYPQSWPGEARGRIPHALLYLERMIRDLGVETIIIDEKVDPDYKPILARLKDKILLSGISSMTGYQIEGGIKFSKHIKQICDSPVLWGGWHPTLMAEQTLKEEYIDFIIAGQGEYPFRELVQKLLTDSNKNDYSQIAGIGYKQKNRIIINSPKKITDIKNFPSIDYRLIDINKYVFKSAYSERCIGYFASHGCPFDCTFCCVAEVFGRRWYNKNIETIINDLKYFKETAHIDSVTFDDDNFFVQKKFVVKLCQEFITQDLNLVWDTSAHAGVFNKIFSSEDMELLYRSGCRQIYVGAESGSQEMLDVIAKHATVEDNYDFVKKLNRYQITPLFSTMVCLPIDPELDFRETLEMIRKAKLIDNSLRARIFFYTPYPGTELYKQAIAKGFKEPTRLEDWASHTLRKFHAPWWTKDYRWQLEIFANFYLPLANPRFYKFAPKTIIPIAFIINKIFYPIVYLRFKLNFLKFPLEAIIFLKILRIFNKVMKTNISLGFESYIE